MKKLKLIDIAPYSGRRVKPFQGFKRYMSTGDLKDEDLNFTEIDFANKPSRADIEVQEGDVLFAKMTNTNKALLIDKELNGIIVSTGFSVHRPKKNELDGEYLFHYLKHDYFHRQKNKLCTGAIQSAISNKGIEKIMVPVPTFPDQLHIANLLSKAENLISQRKESIALLDEFLKSTFLEMFGDPILNKKGWPLERLDNLAKLERGRFSPRPRNNPIYYNGAYPFIQTGDISKSEYRLNNYTQTLNENGIKVSKEFKKGTIVIAIVGATIGATAILELDVYATDSIIGISADKTKTNEQFLEFTLRFWKPVLLSIAPEAARANINLAILNKLKFPNPPIELQTQFAQIVEKTEALKAQYQQSLQELENLYGSLSQRAFKGELKLDKNEESLLMAAEPEQEYQTQSQLSIPPSKKGFAKLVLAGKIINECKDSPEFTNIKFQKLQHLAEHLMEADLNLNYYNQAAGPYDNKFMHTLHNKMNQQKWFASRGYKYSPLEKSNEINGHFSRYFGNNNEQFSKLIKLLGKASEDQCEIISTLYAVWNDRIIKKEPITNEAIIQDFFNWSDRKQKYNSKQLKKAIEWMKENGLEPKGFGELIKHAKKKKKNN